MKYIFINLKRFDIPKTYGGVNSLCAQEDYGKVIMEQTASVDTENTTYACFFQEAHIITAKKAKDLAKNPMAIGCQSVFRADTAVGGNFGAFTTNRTANSMKNLGCEWTIIGHCEERMDKLGIMAEAGNPSTEAVSRLLNKEIKEAQKAGLKVLYCIGEKQEEQEEKYDVLKKQIEIGLDGVDLANVVIAYEPVWSIGPGKTPASKEYIADIANFVKTVASVPVVYGGGLKADNAKMLSEIDSISGGLIALTRFQGDIGFYPEEFLEITDLYLGKK